MDKIDLLEEGSNRTMFSAGVANEVIAALNSLIGLEGKNGIKITKSDSNIVIEFTGATGSVAPATPSTPTDTTNYACLARWA
jgi:hypothetical protein